MDADSEELHQRQLMLNLVVQNLKDVGATLVDDFLGVPSRTQSAEGSPDGQDEQQLRKVNVPSDVNPGGAGSASAPKSIPLPSSAERSSSVVDMDEFTKQVEECCMEWRAGRVKPYWLAINEPKFGRTQGCALRVQISARSAKVYSVETTYSSPAEAQKACAHTAIEQGALDFIKYGDGQATPAVKLGPNDGETFTSEPIPPGLGDVQSWTVQAFYEALPRPFPEPVGDKSASEINGPAWLNTTIQAARGSRLVSNFVWTTDAKSGLHGVLLRLERPVECKSWLVAARFAKRAEAKAAVCLLAMSEGVGEYIRSIIKEVDDRLTPAMRKSINDILVPMLLTEYRKIWPGDSPAFDYENESDGCGCTMTVQLAQNSKPEQVRKYSAPSDYRNRADAKMAVVALAVQQGVIEFIRFQGRPLPPGYTPISLQRFNGFGGNQNRKRKNDSDWPAGQSSEGTRKKFRQNGGFQGQQHGSPSWYQSHRAPLGSGSSIPGGWAGSPPHSHAPVAYSSYPLPTGPTHPYSHPYVGTVTNGDSYSPLAPQLSTPVSTASSPYQPVTGTSAALYAYSSPIPLPPHGQYPSPYPQSAIYSPYQAAGYPVQAYQAYASSQHAPPPPQLQLQPRPQPHIQPATTTQPYTPHTTGAPVMYAMPASSPAPIPSPAQSPWTQQQPQPYAIPIPHNTGMASPYVPAPPPSPSNPPLQPHMSMALLPNNAHYPSAVPMQSILPVQRFSTDVAQRERKSLPKRARGVNGSTKGAPAKSGQVNGGSAQAAPKSSANELYGHCMTHNLGTPQFCNEIVMDDKGESKHKVWIIVGKQRYELPVKFNSLSQGQERVAKRVLEQLRS